MRRTLLFLPLALVTVAPARAQLGGDVFVMDSLGPGVWAALVVDRPPVYAFANSLVVEGERGVLVVDAQASTAATRALIAEVRARTARPVRWLVNTHWHGDHVYGNRAWREAFPDLEIIGHATLPADLDSLTAARARAEIEELRETITARQEWLATGRGPNGSALGDADRLAVVRSLSLRRSQLDELGALRLVPPDRTVTRRLDVDLGGRVVRVLHFGPAHTRGDLVVHVPDQGVIAVGDLLEDGLPWVAESDVVGWAGALDSIASLRPRVVLPAHGRTRHDDALLRDQRALFGATMARAADDADGARALDAVRAAYVERHGVSAEAFDRTAAAIVERARAN